MTMSKCSLKTIQNGFDTLCGKGNIDLIKVELNEPILPCTKQTFTFIYEVKIPDSKFTKYGYDNIGRIILKNWYLNPSRFEHKQFIKLSNENIDDIPNAFSDFDIEFEINIVKINLYFKLNKFRLAEKTIKRN